MSSLDKGGPFFAADDEERLLVARAEELARRSEGAVSATCFLTPREQRIVFEAMKGCGYADKLFMWGGYVGAVRRAAVFLPDWLVGEADISRADLYSSEREEYYLSLLDGMSVSCEELLEEELACLKLFQSGYETLSHRDWLGSLMGLGIKRQMIGDIVMCEGGALLPIRREIGGFLTDQLQKAGRDTVRAEFVRFSECTFSPPKFERISTTVASLRLDGAVRALCSVSREKAADAVADGSVEINYFTEKRPDRHISAGDILTVRGCGKFKIVRAEDITRRGRIRLEADRYI